MENIKLCGYCLAVRGLQVAWANKAYEGYDRRYFFSSSFDPLVDDGTELWQLQLQALDVFVYIPDLTTTIALCDGFSRHSVLLDVLRVRVDLDRMMKPASLVHLSAAVEAQEERFSVLGFDSGWLLGEHSIIYQPGFLNRADDATRQNWAARLNEHGLFPTAVDCEAYRSEFLKDPNHESGDFEILEVSVFRG